jgi:hypothetical protein
MKLNYIRIIQISFLIIFTFSCAKKDPITGEKVLIEPNPQIKAREAVDKGGGIFGDVIGGIEGGTMLQIPIQGSGMSNALVQIGSISPSTHMHLHAALVFSE